MHKYQKERTDLKVFVDNIIKLETQKDNSTKNYRNLLVQESCYIYKGDTKVSSFFI